MVTSTRTIPITVCCVGSVTAILLLAGCDPNSSSEKGIGDQSSNGATNADGTPDDDGVDAGVDDGVDDGEATELALEPSAYLVLTRAVEGPSPHDLDYLAALPAAMALTDGRPAVLAVPAHAAAAEQPWLADYLQRYRAENVMTLGAGLEEVIPDAQARTLDVAAPGAATALLLAQTVWKRAERVVVCSSEDFTSALLAAGLAARLRLPLLFASPETREELEQALHELEVQSAIYVGGEHALPVQTESLPAFRDVVAWLQAAGEPVRYLAAVNPEDRQAHADGSKVSLVAPLFAAIRQGVVAPLPDGVGYQALRDALREHYAATDHSDPPTSLALVGTTSFIPFAQVPTVYPDLVTDAPYGDMDADPFLEIGVGRIVSNNLSEATLLAARIASYPRLLDGSWEKHTVGAGAFLPAELFPLVRNTGYSVEVLAEQDIAARQTLESALVLHNDHSYYLELGHAFWMQTTTLLAPAVVLSAGCGTAGIDKDPEAAIVKHLLRQGAVAFLGAPRGAEAMSQHMEAANLNAVLAGQTLGEGFRNAFNELTVTFLDGDVVAAADYARYNWTLMGDPAFAPHVPTSPQQRPAQAVAEVGGSTVVVTAPETWWEVPVTPGRLQEWGWDSALFYLVGAGISPMRYWSSPGYNRDEHYLTVAYHTDKVVTSISQQTDVPEPLGWGGSFADNVHVDEHFNDRRTYHWRVRLVDFDQEDGSIRAQQDQIVYSVAVAP